MFYMDQHDEALRFGDVVKGYVSSYTRFEKPIKNRGEHQYDVDITFPLFSVILTPCCSISDKIVTLAPLKQIRPAFYKNPYFEEDFTRINRLIEPEKTVPPHVWDKFPEEQKEKRLSEGMAYALTENFIYEPHELLPTYTIHKQSGQVETNYYMVDFKDAYKVNCKSLITPSNAPLDSKYLQLSIGTRSELRDKIAYYYGRVPKEDKIE